MLDRKNSEEGEKRKIKCNGMKGRDCGRERVCEKKIREREKNTEL